MDVFSNIGSDTTNALRCIDMHTTGGPVRILFGGFPDMPGKTLLEQREIARSTYDHLRQRIMREPRGHREMYGCALVKTSELTSKSLADGGAHIAVLLMHHEGFSDMCGHVTMGLGRFLVDTHDLDIFPQRNLVSYDETTMTAELRLHMPCGIVTVTVPVLDGGKKSDPNRNVSFVLSSAYATAMDLNVSIPAEHIWKELPDGKLSVDIMYGGAFYIYVSAKELGFSKGLKGTPVADLQLATKVLKAAIYQDATIYNETNFPISEDLRTIVGVVVYDKEFGLVPAGLKGAELGINIYGKELIDRSPCGSASAARVALAYLKGERSIGERWGYHSLVSASSGGQGIFVAAPLAEIEIPVINGIKRRGVVVRVEGQSFYTGASTFVTEEVDMIAESGICVDDMPSIIEMLP